MNWTSEAVKKAVELIQGSPLHFMRTVLGEEPYDKQLPIIDALRDHRRVAVKSGHSCGKDWLAARLALWFHVSHYPSIVVATGPTERQVVNVVWGEIANAYNKAKERAIAGEAGAIPIGGKLLTQELHTIPRSKDHYMIGYTARSGQSADFSGFHSDNILIVVTEASGIDAETWKGINSLMTAKEKARLLVVGNPISDVGSEFYQMFTSKAELYKTFTLDSEESPYCSKEWIAELAAEFPVGSPVYNARVKGLFQDDLGDVLIPLSALEAARARWLAQEQGLEKIPEFWLARPETAGVDVARFGSDLTAQARLRAGKLWIAKTKQGQDLMWTAGECINLNHEDGIKPENIRVDDTGLGGGVTDRCAEGCGDASHDHSVTPINFGSSAVDDLKFEDARTEIAWHFRLAVTQQGLALDPRNNRLLRDLSGIKYKMTGKGRLKLEPKAETKKRLSYSPDEGDSAFLAAVPADVAERLAGETRAPGAGLIEYMKQRAGTAGSPKAIPVQKRSLEDVPGVRPVTPGVSDAEAAKIAAARLRYSSRPESTTAGPF